MIQRERIGVSAKLNPDMPKGRPLTKDTGPSQVTPHAGVAPNGRREPSR